MCDFDVQNQQLVNAGRLPLLPGRHGPRFWALVERTMFRRGVLVLGAGKNAIRLAPPLVLTRDQADILLKVMDRSSMTSLPAQMCSCRFVL